MRTRASLGIVVFAIAGHLFAQRIIGPRVYVQPRAVGPRVVVPPKAPYVRPVPRPQLPTKVQPGPDRSLERMRRLFGIPDNRPRIPTSTTGIRG